MKLDLWEIEKALYEDIPKRKQYQDMTMGERLYFDAFSAIFKLRLWKEANE